MSDSFNRRQVGRGHRPTRYGGRRGVRRCARPCHRPNAQRKAARPERLDLRPDRAVPHGHPRHGAALRPRHVSEPARDHHGRTDDGCLCLGRHAGQLPALELRQGIHQHREKLPPWPDGPGLRNRHQLQPLHQLSDGGEHDGHAGAGDRARGLRPQQLLQGQLPLPDVDRRFVDHRLPRLRQELRPAAAKSATEWMPSNSCSTVAMR
jgi:hypothetical protein